MMGIFTKNQHNQLVRRNLSINSTIYREKLYINLHEWLNVMGTVNEGKIYRSSHGWRQGGICSLGSTTYDVSMDLISTYPGLAPDGGLMVGVQGDDGRTSESLGDDGRTSSCMM